LQRPVGARRWLRTLVVMKKRQGSAWTAGALYLMFAVFSAGVLLLSRGEVPIDQFLGTIRAIPGAVEFLSVVVGLAVASLLMGAWLFFRRRVNVVVLIVGAVMAAVAITWNVMAVLFWLAPLPLLWISYRSANDD
jgi:hypothetical protein